ncbi:MAG: trypsin-like peptidase domain-containing protein [Dermatophilaceae bacterium]
MTDHPGRPDPHPGPAAPLSPPHLTQAAGSWVPSSGTGTAPTQQVPVEATQQLPTPGRSQSEVAGYGPPPQRAPYEWGSAPAYGPGQVAQPPYGPADPGGRGQAIPPSTPPRRGTGLLVVAAVLGLVAGLLGGAVAYVAVERIRGTTSQSPLPAPAPGATTRPDGSIAQIAAKALPSVVTIRIRGADGSGTGSGFVIDTSGHILTNNHVIASAATSSDTITVDLSDGTTMGATIVGRDASYDLAVLKADRTDLPPLGFGRSADVVVGDGVIAVGAPLGLDATVTSGIVSAVDRPVAAGGGDETSFINAIQTDAAINPGNSGGPLLDLNGKVIGVNSAIARVPGSSSGTGGNIGVGFAIPSDQAYKTAQQLITTGKAVHPVIGVRLDRQYDGSGAKILDNGGVTSASAAADAGLQDGDVIVGFEGRRITDPDQLVVAIRARSVGDTVRLTVQRGGQQLDMSLTLQSGT